MKLMVQKRTQIKVILSERHLLIDAFPTLSSVEAKLLRLTNEYFEAEMKRLKRHKEKLSKTLHQKLFARHHFKIAYYAEFMQDLKTALKCVK